MKDKLRGEIKKIRKNLSREEVFEKSKKIKKQLFKIDEFKQANNILFYVSYNNEVNTHEMIKECLSSKKHVIVPITDKENRCLIVSKLEKWDDLEIGAYGILEPKKDAVKEVSIDIIDLVIVPGLVFDLQGHRIGHGMGYYDRLLKQLKNILSVGLAFEYQIIEKIPVDEYDVPVSMIITEDGTIELQGPT